MNNILFKIAVILVLAAATLTAVPRKLIVVNSLGETADFANLEDGTISLQVATLGLAPNKFLVSGSGAIGAAINSTSNDVSYFNLPSFAPAGSLFLGNGRNPYGGALWNNIMVITNLTSSTLTKANLGATAVISEHSVGKSPEGIVVVGNFAYICITNFDFGNFTYGQGRVEKFDLVTNTVVDFILVGTNPQDIVQGYDGNLYVVCTGDYFSQFGVVYKLNPQTDAVVDSVSTGGSPGGIAITRQGVIFLAAGGFVGNGEIYTLNVNTFTLKHGPANPLHTDLGVTAVLTVSDSTIVSCNFSDDTITEIDSSGHIYRRLGTGDGPVSVAKYPGCFLQHGDADGSGSVNVSDAVRLIQYIFAGGASPVTRFAGDANCDGSINITDAVFVIHYIFVGGALCGCAD